MARHFHGPHLRRLRTTADLRREHVAVAISRSSNAIAGYERGTVQPSVATLAALGDLFGCSMDEFFADDAVGAGGRCDP